MLRIGMAVAVVCLCAAMALGETSSYSWESCQSPLGTYGEPLWQIGRTQVHDGMCALEIAEDAPTGTPQVYVAWVKDLGDGDVVTASFWRYDDTPGASPSARIWGHWNDDLIDVNAYHGSAGGNDDYGPGTGWDLAEHSWTVADGHTGLVIEARVYGMVGEFVPIDEIVVNAPDGAYIQFPPPCIDYAVEGVEIEWDGDYFYVFATIDAYVFGDEYGVGGDVNVTIDGIYITDVPWIVEQIPWESCYFDSPANGCQGTCNDRTVNGETVSGTCVSWTIQDYGPRCACRYRLRQALTNAIPFNGQQLAQVVFNNWSSRDEPCTFELNLDNNEGEAEIVQSGAPENATDTTWSTLKALYR
jgi:hypothetical protein